MFLVKFLVVLQSCFNYCYICVPEDVVCMPQHAVFDMKCFTSKCWLISFVTNILVKYKKIELFNQVKWNSSQKQLNISCIH